MEPFETSATVEDQGRVHLVGVPFVAGTQVEITISPKVSQTSAHSDGNGEALAAARARMQELFSSIKGFRMAPKLSREELYDREGLR